MGENNLVLFVLKEDLSLLEYEKNVVSDFEIPLISGAARFAMGLVPQFCLTDNSGEDHISDRYARYGYFTSIYWAWKNADASFVGLVSDRAHVNISDEEMYSLMLSGADAILPMQAELPVSLRAFYAEQFYGYDLEVLSELVRIERPEYYDIMMLLLNNNTMFEHCCGIYTAEVLDEFCEFAFPLLKQIDEMSAHRSDLTQNRMVEHLGDILHYVFFMANYDRFCLKQAPFFRVEKEVESKKRMLSEFDILQYTKTLFREKDMEGAADFLNRLDKKHLVYTDVNRIRNMLQIHRIQKMKYDETVLDRMPDVDALIKHHEKLENYIVNYMSDTGYSKDFLRYIDNNRVAPDEVLYIMQYFKVNSADVYIKFITLFQEVGKMEFVLPFMEAAVQKRNCVAAVEAKMREVVMKLTTV